MCCFRNLEIFAIFSWERMNVDIKKGSTLPSSRFLIETATELTIQILKHFDFVSQSWLDSTCSVFLQCV